MKGGGSCQCDFAQFGDGSERAHFGFFSEKMCPKSRKIQSLKKTVRLWQFGLGQFSVPRNRCLRRGNVHLLGFLTLEKIDFFCENFHLENWVT